MTDKVTIPIETRPAETPKQCHCCETTGADLYECPRCDQLTCEDCFDTHWRPGEPPDCLECVGRLEAADWEERRKDAEIEEARKKKRDARNAAARARYWKPENVAKRRKARTEKKQRQAREAQDRLKAAFRIVGEMMR